MKNYLLVLLPVLLWCSCNRPPSESKTVGLDISIDTVLINTGEDFINLRNGIYFSGLSNDNKFLFNSGVTSPYLERVNLETLQFEERMIFDEDGPNAFGEYVNGVSTDVNNNLILTSWYGTSIFNLEKQKLKKYLLSGNNFEGDNLEGREEFVSKIIPSHNYKTVFGLVQNFESREIFLAIVDEETNSLQKIPLEGFERAEEFSVTYSSGGGGATMSHQQTEMARLGDKLVITNPIFSKIAVYDLEGGNLKYYDCEPSLTASAKVGKYTNDVHSEEELEIEKIKIGEEVTFLPLMMDLNNEKYVRLSVIGKPKLNEKGIPEINDHRVFVSVLNDSFEVVREVEVVGGVGKLFSTPIPQKPFLKDGKIWLYLNIEDELAFVRLDLGS